MQMPKRHLIRGSPIAGEVILGALAQGIHPTAEHLEEMASQQAQHAHWRLGGGT